MITVKQIFENTTKDVYSAIYTDGKTLFISAGTPSRLTSEFIAKRFKTLISKLCDGEVSVAITNGLNELKNQYSSDCRAEGKLLLDVGINGDSEALEIPVCIFIKEILFDHDLGSDCDDGGAAAMLIKAHRDGYCKAIGITGCVFNPYASICVKIMCDYFGVDDIPIGVNTERDTLTDPCWYSCSKAPAEKYYPDGNFPELESNVPLIRKALLNSHGDVTVLTTGCLATIEALMESGADENSDKTGEEIFNENIGHFVIGGTKYPEGTWENNLGMDPEATKLIFNKYLDTKSYHVTICGAEVSGIVYSGDFMRDEKFNGYVLKDIYNFLRPGDYHHNSWDQGVMYFSIFGIGSKHFDISAPCTVKASENDGCLDIDLSGGEIPFVIRKSSPDILTKVYTYWMQP